MSTTCQEVTEAAFFAQVHQWASQVLGARPAMAERKERADILMKLAARDAMGLPPTEYEAPVLGLSDPAKMRVFDTLVSEGKVRHEDGTASIIWAEGELERLRSIVGDPEEWIPRGPEDWFHDANREHPHKRGGEFSGPPKRYGSPEDGQPH